MSSRPTNNTLLALSELGERINLLHNSINERLELKDRWINTIREDLEKQIMSEINGVSRNLELLREALAQSDARLLDGISTNRELYQKGLDRLVLDLDRRIAEVRDTLTTQQENSWKSHDVLHDVAKEAQNEFKNTVQHRLNVLQKGIDDLKVERGLFVLRDSYDSKIETIEKNLDGLEKTTRENLESGLKLVREQTDARFTTMTERITKIEQSIQITNARNQQSIIALGILLTLVEIIIRYYR